MKHTEAKSLEMDGLQCNANQQDFSLVSITRSIQNQKKALSSIQRLYFETDNIKRSDDSTDITIFTKGWLKYTHTCIYIVMYIHICPNVLIIYSFIHT